MGGSGGPKQEADILNGWPAGRGFAPRSADRLRARGCQGGRALARGSEVQPTGRARDVRSARGLQVQALPLGTDSNPCLTRANAAEARGICERSELRSESPEPAPTSPPVNQGRTVTVTYTFNPSDVLVDGGVVAHAPLLRVGGGLWGSFALVRAPKGMCKLEAGRLSEVDCCLRSSVLARRCGVGGRSSSLTAAGGWALLNPELGR